MTLAFLPNEADATNANQAEPDSVDFEILLLGYDDTGVVSGCAVTESGTPAQTIDVAVGAVRLSGQTIVVSAQAAVAATAADGSNPRFDLISVNSSGTVVVTAGTAAAEPVLPGIPATSVPLATLYVDTSDNTHTDDQINDKRVTVPAATVFNVKDYGATGDGATDDRVAIQAAITAAETAGGGEIYFPYGIYMVSENTGTNNGLDIAQQTGVGGKPLFLRGEGWGEDEASGSGSVIRASETGIVDLINIKGKFVRIEGLCFDGNDIATNCINLDASAANGYAARLVDVKAEQAEVASVIVDHPRSVIHSCLFSGQDSGAPASSIALDIQTLDCMVSNTHIRFAETGLRIGEAGNQFVNCHISENDEWAAVIEAPRSFFSNCQFDAGTRAGITSLVHWDADTATAHLVGLTFTGCYFYAPNVTDNTAPAIDVSNGTWTAKRLLVSGCQFEAANGNAFSAAVKSDTVHGHWGFINNHLFHCQATYDIADGALIPNVRGNLTHTDANGDVVFMTDPVNAKEEAGSRTLTWNDSILNVECTGGWRTITLPDNAEFSSKAFLVRRDGATNGVSINRSGSDTYDDGHTQKNLDSDGAAIGIFSIGDGEWKIVDTVGTVNGS